MNDIVRKETNERLSHIVIHGEIDYIAGVTSPAEGGLARHAGGDHRDGRGAAGLRQRADV